MDLKKETFLVTGAAGFVGASLTRRLLEMGLNKVHALVAPNGDLWRIKDILPSLNLHCGDITDEAYIQDLIGEISPSIIYHLATYGAYPVQNNIKRIMMTNVIGTCNIGTGRQVSLKEITDIVLELTGSPIEVHWNAIPGRIWDSSLWVGDVEHAKHLLGWEAKTSLEQGLMQTMEWSKRQ